MKGRSQPPSALDREAAGKTKANGDALMEALGGPRDSKTPYLRNTLYMIIGTLIRFKVYS